MPTSKRSDSELGTLLPNPKNCNSFNECTAAGPVLKTCPANLHFNAVKSSCDWPEIANCQISDCTETPEECGQCENEETLPCDWTCPAVDPQTGPGSYFPAVERNSFYLCSNGCAYKFSCSTDNLVFNTEKLTCDYPGNVPVTNTCDFVPQCNPDVDTNCECNSDGRCTIQPPIEEGPQGEDQPPEQESDHIEDENEGEEHKGDNDGEDSDVEPTPPGEDSNENEGEGDGSESGDNPEEGDQDQDDSESGPEDPPTEDHLEVVHNGEQVKLKLTLSIGLKPSQSEVQE